MVLEPLGVCYRTVRQIESGADFFMLVAGTYPEIHGPALAQAGRFMEQGLALEGAREAYERSLAADQTPEVYRRLGRLMMRTGAIDEAVAAFRSGLELDPSDSRLQYSLAQALRQRGDLEKAGAIVEELLKNNDNHADAWAFLGQIHHEKGRNEEARGALRTCLELDPDNIQARFLLARFALREGDLDLFRRHLARVVQVEETLGRGPKQDE